MVPTQTIRWLSFATVAIAAAVLVLTLTRATADASPILLPKPAGQGAMSVEQALGQRRSHRSFGPDPLSLEQLGQLLWAADGINGKSGDRELRTAPSAGALYPVDLYVAIGEPGVRDLAAGIYRYRSSGHQLELVQGGDRRNQLARDALSQMWTAEAPVVFVITGAYSRVTAKYGERAEIYTHVEVGHVGQNLFLQTEALGLKAGIVGGLDVAAVSRTLRLPEGQIPFVIMPVGTPH